MNGQRFDWLNYHRGQTRKCMVARVENSAEITTKTRLAENMQRYAAAHNISCSWIPETYILTCGAKGAFNLERLKKPFARHYATGDKVWILKPSGRNRGNGIEIVDSLQAVDTLLKAAAPGSKWAVQKYIERPMLLNGRKFDIRSYVLITPDGCVHMYHKSYVRTSSRNFSLEDLSDRSTHLTNDAIQVKFDDYGAFEDSNKLTMEQLQEQLGAAIDLQAAIIPQMQDCARHAFAAVQDKLNPQKHSLTFELYGLDFMIDLAGKVYLIEVNNCPALYRHGQILTDLLPLVIEEVAQKSIDPYFPPPEGSVLPEPLDGFKMLLESGDTRKASRYLRKSSSTGSTGRASIAAGRFRASRTRMGLMQKRRTADIPSVSPELPPAESSSREQPGGSSQEQPGGSSQSSEDGSASPDASSADESNNKAGSSKRSAKEAQRRPSLSSSIKRIAHAYSKSSSRNESSASTPRTGLNCRQKSSSDLLRRNSSLGGLSTKPPFIAV